MRCHDLGSLDFLMKMTEVVVVVVVGRTIVCLVSSVGEEAQLAARIPWEETG